MQSRLQTRSYNINKKAAILPLKQIFKPLRKKGCRVLIQRGSLFLSVSKLLIFINVNYFATTALNTRRRSALPTEKQRCLLTVFFILHTIGQISQCEVSSNSPDDFCRLYGFYKEFFLPVVRHAEIFYISGNQRAQAQTYAL